MLTSQKIRWYDSIQMRFQLGFAIILLVLLATVTGVVKLLARDMIAEKNSTILSQTGSKIVSQLGAQIMLAESLTQTMADLGQFLPKNKDLFHNLVPKIMAIPGQEKFIAGGGIWPEPRNFDQNIERHSFFWGRNSEGEFNYFDNYNDPEGQGYHQEDWYVSAMYSPRSQCVWSKSYTDPYSIEPMVTCSVAMRIDDKPATGVATIDIKLSGLKDYLETASESIGGYAFALDHTNKFLSYPNLNAVIQQSSPNNQVGKHEFISASDLAKKDNKFEPFIAPLNALNAEVIRAARQINSDISALIRQISDNSYQINDDEAVMLSAILLKPFSENSRSLPQPLLFGLEDDAIFNEPVLVSVLLVPKTYWKIVVVVPKRLAIDSANFVVSKVLFSLIFIVLLFAAACYLLIRGILINPINKMSQQLLTTFESDRDDAAILDDQSRDELGLLAHRFNQQTLALDKINQAVNSEIKIRYQVENALRLSEQRFRAVAESAPDAVISANNKGLIIAWNPAAEMIFGINLNNALNSLVTELLSETDSIEQSHRINRYLTGIDAVLDCQVAYVQAIRLNGETFPAEFSLASWETVEGRYFTCFMRDITQRTNAEKEIHYLAQHDPLTKLPNRALFQDRLKQAVVFAQRNRRKVGLLFMDLDNFKVINDTLGHGIGDQLLEAVTQRILEFKRETDTLARLGGDEFAMILPDIDSSKAAANAANRIVQCIQHPFQIDQNNLHIGASVGITLFPDDAADPSTLVKNADIAMYQAKADGRNTFRAFVNEMDTVLQHRKQLITDLEIALKSDQFTLHYQPLVSLMSGEIIGVEALLRWQHPTRGSINPSEFIPIAEQTGMIKEIGDWVIQSACEQFNRLDSAGLSDIIIAINISPVQFKRPELPSTIEKITAALNVNPRRLQIEITESAIMDNVDGAIQIMHKLNRIGIALSIDDFGTGYSSLSALKRFPINILKIDQSFIADLIIDSGSKAIVNAVIKLGHSMGLTVLAEGVESSAQYAFLQENGCDQLQGYWVAKPLSMDEFISWMTDSNYANPDSA